MENIKIKLKGAREAIKNKDYEISLKLSEAILKEDEGNYMALIFMGLSFQEVGLPDQAPKAFQKAIESNPSNPLAWNGLINYYEKIDSVEANQELIKLYSSVVFLKGYGTKNANHDSFIRTVRPQSGGVAPICLATTRHS